MITATLAIYLALESCAPGVNEVSARLAQRGQVYGFTRDPIRAHTLNVCVRRDPQTVEAWHRLMIRLPLTDPDLRAEYVRVVRETKARLEGREVEP